MSGPRGPRNRALLRRNVIVAASTTAAVALLLSYHTSLDSGGAEASAAAPVTVAGASSSSSASTAVGGTGSTTATGDRVDTRFGPVQVEITVQDGRIVAVDAVVSPDGDRRSVEINERALPVLDEQALAAQSASIDGVSGATYTSEAYAQSLQSAIDGLSVETATTAGAAAPTTTEAATATATATGTFTGDSVDTRFGPVQVEITVQDGRVVAADAVASPDGDGRSIRINDQAVPELNAQAVAAQDAGIDGVSGATYTSEAYARSLQSALDQAGLATAVTG